MASLGHNKLKLSVVAARTHENAMLQKRQHKENQNGIAFYVWTII